MGKRKASPQSRIIKQLESSRESNKEYDVSYSEDEFAIYETLTERERITPNDITNENLPPLDSRES